MSVHNSHLVLAVSGGIDSIVMVDLFAKSGYSFTIAHCNFQLRDDESERDETFVKSLEEKYNKTVLVKKFDTKNYAEENKLSIQEAARKLRYDWFYQLTVDSQQSMEVPSSVDYKPLTALATAHHANDNIETVLMNIFRGTGISGLHGIPLKQNHIIRPLLFAKREKILQYAQENNLQWVEDSSNKKDDYTRNYFRQQLIPQLQTIFPKAEENILQNIERWKEAESFYDESIASTLKKIITQKNNEIHLPVLLLQKQKNTKTILHEIVKDYGFTAHQLDDILNLLKAESGKYIASQSHRIIKNRNWLIISPNQTTEADNILIEENDNEIEFENGTLLIQNSKLKTQNKEQYFSSDNYTVTIDAKHISYPLMLRKWKQGDYFYPLGMDKKKKLSRFFIDNKLSITDKEKIWVIESNKKIVWIAGYRIDNRFRLTEQTENILKLQIKK